MNASADLRARQAGPEGAGTAGPIPLKFAVHGPAVEVENFVPALGEHVRRLLGPFAASALPTGFAAVHGIIRPYEHAEVIRHLSPAARPLPRVDDLAEVFEDGERFWIVDERWGMAEINFLKGQWRSWVLPGASLDLLKCAEMAVLWPLAQLLRPRGVYLLPAAAAVRDGWAFLLVCPFGVEPELSSLLRSGYKLIGHRWTAVREDDGRMALLHMPGSADGMAAPAAAWQHHAFCDAVLVADPGRRPRASVKQLDPASAAALLRRAWPIAELHPSRRRGPLPAKLAQQCRCAEVQLSRDPDELLPLLDRLRAAAPAAARAA